MCSSNKGRMEGKVAVVVGAARGIGKGIARDLFLEGGNVAVCDKAIGDARNFVEELDRNHRNQKVAAIYVDTTNEETVSIMVDKIVEIFGGIDILIYSAGVNRSGSIKNYNLEDFELVNRINYTGYFLCVKYVSRVMSEQYKRDPSRIMDIIQINSKSGLQGSKRNFAYAGSKFGGIGLTQSFALELIDDGIKVNAVCPGNYFESMLWSDPKKGMFVQYLKAGKIPKAKNVVDVRRYYESKIPMGRGCTIEEIVRAVYYVIDQKGETGQAIPVTGGQIMR